jgi:hypothetical protein
MPNDFDGLVRWVCDVKRILWMLVDGLREHLDSEDEEARSVAQRQMSELLDYLLPPVTAKQCAAATSSRRRNLKALLEREGYSATDIARIMTKVTLTARCRGRPREHGLDAIRALGLKLRTEKSWREIALDVRGSCRRRKCASYCSTCKDVRRSVEPGRLDRERRLRKKCEGCKFTIRPKSQKQRVCYKCADQVRHLAEELRDVLIGHGVSFLPVYPLIPLEKNPND